MQDELHQPLGQPRRPDETVAGGADRSGPRRWSTRSVGYGLVGAALAIPALYVAKYGDADGGRPRVIARIEQVKPVDRTPPQAPVASREADVTGSVETRASERQTGQDVERHSGVKVIRPGGAEAPGALIIQIEEPSGVRLAPAPDKRLVEKDRSGLLPRIGSDGSKPSEIYARPLVVSQKLKSGAPRIALIVGGLGLSSTTTQAAMERLPADVSFAFAPYGNDLARDVSRARDNGHEVFLQVPMEPFDYPQNDPGPHTLTTRASPEEATADLRWLMTRFTGYVGVMNFLGARFSSTEPALTPVLRELAGRGVAFIDDGSSPQSLATSLAPGVGLASARADIVIDADKKHESIEAALSRLEAIAREKGFALGVASAIPQSVERVSRFARGLEQRGIALVPASAALTRGGAAQAESRRP
jgi:uncharacterized protein